MKGKSIPRKVTPARDQSREWASFVDALNIGHLSLARDCITHIFVYTEVFTKDGKYPAKKLGYELIFDFARKSGDLDAMLEVAPFSGHTVTRDDYIKCKKNASKANRPKDKKACKKVLQRKWSD